VSCYALQAAASQRAAAAATADKQTAAALLLLNELPTLINQVSIFFCFDFHHFDFD
jgi:hypothetical protein